MANSVERRNKEADLDRIHLLAAAKESPRSRAAQALGRPLAIPDFPYQLTFSNVLVCSHGTLARCHKYSMSS